MKTDKEEYCTCNSSKVYADTNISSEGYWLVCANCNKKIENEFHEYNHYDGEDHDLDDDYE